MPLATITPRAPALSAATPTKYGSLAPSRCAAATPMTSTSREFEALELHEVADLAPATLCQRSVSCFEFGSDARRFRTLRLGSDELRRLARANVDELARTATSTAAQDATNALLARKALRYRKISSASDAITSLSAARASC